MQPTKPEIRMILLRKWICPKPRKHGILSPLCYETFKNRDNYRQPPALRQQQQHDHVYNIRPQQHAQGTCQGLLPADRTKVPATIFVTALTAPS